MFCTHFIVIEIVRGILLKLIGIHNWSVLLICVATFIGTIIIVSVSESISKKLLSFSLWKMITGGRS